MWRLSILFALPSVLLTLNTPDNPWGEYAPDCIADKPFLFNKDNSIKKWYKIDLDADPHDMWREIAADFGERMYNTIGVVKTMVDSFGGKGAWDNLLNLFVGADDLLDEPYRSEIKAMANLTGIDVERLTLLNLFYEIAKACTSVVAMDEKGKVYHGRNQDFGLFFVWNTEEHTWDLTIGLKKLVAQLEFYRGGKLLFRAVTFAGHLGVLTAVKPGQFSLSTNSRFGSTLDTMTNFFNGLNDGRQFLIYADRDMMTNYDTFEEAKEYIEKVPLLARGYFIMGSTKGGVVVTRSKNETDHEAVIDQTKKNGWYVLQTNYDWNEPDIFLDDRTNPGNKCMQQLGRKRVSMEGLFQVLNSQANLNKATVYTTIMDVESGDLYSFIQSCPDPCWFI